MPPVPNPSSASAVEYSKDKTLFLINAAILRIGPQPPPDVEEALYRACSRWLLVENVEDRFHGPDRIPRCCHPFDKCPVEWAEEQMLVPPSSERILDLGANS